MTDLLLLIMASVALWPWWAPVASVLLLLAAVKAARTPARTRPDTPPRTYRRCPDKGVRRVRECGGGHRVPSMEYPLTCADTVRPVSGHGVRGHGDGVS